MKARPLHPHPGERPLLSALALSPLLLLANCDDKDAATKDNFKTALSKAFHECTVLTLGGPRDTLTAARRAHQGAAYLAHAVGY